MGEFVRAYRYSSIGWLALAALVELELRQTCQRMDFPAARDRPKRSFAVEGRRRCQRIQKSRQCLRTMMAVMTGKDLWRLSAIQFSTVKEFDQKTFRDF